jgi:hypothetical protein
MLRALCIGVFVFLTTVNVSQTFSFDSIFALKPILKSVSENSGKHRLQIIYTQINRDSNGKPSFKTYSYHASPSNYFYCASLVKLPCSILALEKLKEIAVDKESIIFTDSVNSCQKSVKHDTSNFNGFPSIANYIRRMFLVSDNFAYGRVYEFLGVDYIHQRLAQLGFPDVRIINRFDGNCKGTEHLLTNPVGFYDSNMKLLYRQNQQQSASNYKHPLGSVKVGKAYINANNKKALEPKDFTNMNYMSLQDVHAMMFRLIFSEQLAANETYNLTKEDRLFLINYLTLLPRESEFPRYNPKEYYDSYKKYFIYGDTKKSIANTDLKIINIVGQSYGFMSDCAYIYNEKDKVEFMLSAVIYANADEILNDGKYEYNSIALPFLAELGRQIYQYELKRNK